jgi:hypothetical protein
MQENRGIHRRGLVHELHYTRRPRQTLLAAFERIKREDHVGGAEGLAVTPVDARAQPQRQLAIVGAVGVTLREPGRKLVGKRAKEEERLIEQTQAILVSAT